jgi:hypothetical protein
MAQAGVAGLRLGGGEGGRWKADSEEKREPHLGRKNHGGDCRVHRDY